MLTHTIRTSTRDELSVFENIQPFATKKEAYGICIVGVDGVFVLTHVGNINNPLSKRFTQRYLVNLVSCSSIREDILSTIRNHFDNHSKDLYVHKNVASIGHASEITAFKESKLNVCKICFNHCAQNYINQYIRKEHTLGGILYDVPRTTGYPIPNVDSPIYTTKKTTSTIKGSHTHLRHEDKSLRTINANLYYGEGYPQYLYSENTEERVPVFETVRRFILQDRPHFKGTHRIYSRVLREGILKVPVILIVILFGVKRDSN